MLQKEEVCINFARYWYVILECEKGQCYFCMLNNVTSSIAF